jgi:hypothetical protein
MPAPPQRLVHVFSVIAMLAVMTACYAVTEEPPRPAAVPADAFWVGGPDGGVFMRLEPTASDAATYSGAIYNQFDGSVWYEGRLTLNPADGAPFDVKDRKQIAGWNGFEVLLYDGRALVADVK